MPACLPTDHMSLETVCKLTFVACDENRDDFQADFFPLHTHIHTHTGNSWFIGSTSVFIYFFRQHAAVSARTAVDFWSSDFCPCWGTERRTHVASHTHTHPQALNNICRFNGVLRVFCSVAMNLGQRQQAKSHNVISYMYSDHGTSVGYLKIKI